MRARPTMLAVFLILGAATARGSAPECVEGAAMERLLSTFEPTQREPPLPRELSPKRPDSACSQSDGRLLCFRRTRGLVPEQDWHSALIGLYQGDGATAQLDRLCHVPAKYSRDEVNVSFLRIPARQRRTVIRLDYPSGWGTGFKVMHTAVLDLSNEGLNVGPVFPTSCRVASLGLELDVQGELSPREHDWSVSYQFKLKNTLRGLDATGNWRGNPSGDAKAPGATEQDALIGMLNELCETRFPQ